MVLSEKSGPRATKVREGIEKQQKRSNVVRRVDRLGVGLMELDVIAHDLCGYYVKAETSDR